MPEETVILHGAPTLAGIKTGSLFRCEYADAEEMRSSLSAITSDSSPYRTRSTVWDSATIFRSDDNLEVNVAAIALKKMF